VLKRSRTKKFGPDFFALFWILPEKFSAKKISAGKFLQFSTFNLKIFGPANFQPEFF